MEIQAKLVEFVHMLAMNPMWVEFSSFATGYVFVCNVNLFHWNCPTNTLTQATGVAGAAAGVSHIHTLRAGLARGVSCVCPRP